MNSIRVGLVFDADRTPAEAEIRRLDGSIDQLAQHSTRASRALGSIGGESRQAASAANRLGDELRDVQGAQGQLSGNRALSEQLRRANQEAAQLEAQLRDVRAAQARLSEQGSRGASSSASATSAARTREAVQQLTQAEQRLTQQTQQAAQALAQLSARAQRGQVDVSRLSTALRQAAEAQASLNRHSRDYTPPRQGTGPANPSGNGAGPDRRDPSNQNNQNNQNGSNRGASDAANGSNEATRALRVLEQQLDAVRLESSELDRELRNLGRQGPASASQLARLSAEGRRIRQTMSDLERNISATVRAERALGQQSGLSAAQLDRLSRRAAEASREVNGLSTRARTANRGLLDFHGTLGLIAGSAAGASVVMTAAAIERLKAQLSTFSDDVGGEFDYLSETAERLNTSVLAMGRDYAKFLALEDGGLVTHQESRDLLEGMQDAGSRYGATAAEVGMSIYGLNQALGSSNVAWEEVKQITEPMPGLLNEIARTTGITTSQMKQLAANGQISGEMFKVAMIETLERFEGTAESTSGTISATFADMQTAYTLLVEEYEKPISMAAVGAMEGVISATELLKNNTAAINAVLLIAGTRFAQYAAASIAASGALTRFNSVAAVTRGIVSFLGGPLGIGLLAGYLGYELSKSTDTFASSNRSANEALERLADLTETNSALLQRLKGGHATAEEATRAHAKATTELSKAQAQLALQEANLATKRREQSLFNGSIRESGVVPQHVEAAVSAGAQRVNELKALIATLDEQVAILSQPVDPPKTPDLPPPPKGTSWRDLLNNDGDDESSEPKKVKVKGVRNNGMIDLTESQGIKSHADYLLEKQAEAQAKLAEETAQRISQAADGMAGAIGDSLTKLATGSKVTLEDFTNTVIEQALRAMVIQPLVQGLSQSFQAGLTSMFGVAHPGADTSILPSGTGVITPGISAMPTAGYSRSLEPVAARSAALPILSRPATPTSSPSPTTTVQVTQQIDARGADPATANNLRAHAQQISDQTVNRVMNEIQAGGRMSRAVRSAAH